MNARRFLNATLLLDAVLIGVNFLALVRTAGSDAGDRIWPSTLVIALIAGCMYAMVEIHGYVQAKAATLAASVRYTEKQIELQDEVTSKFRASTNVSFAISAERTH